MPLAPTSVRRATPFLVVATAFLLLTGCIRTVDPSLEAFELTPRGDENYDITVWGSGIVVGADEANQAGTNRMGFWRRSDPVATDVETCATWTVLGSAFHQEGATLRLRPFGQGVRAITVTKNVYENKFWVFNIHVWDTNNTDAPFTMVGTFDLSSTLGGGNSGRPLEPFPWRLCARARGNQVDFVVWPTSQAPPAYGTPGRGGSATVDGGWVNAGSNGWYAGHLQAGARVAFSDLSVTPL